MTRVPMKVHVPRYICSELEDIRKMIKTHDFSGLLASVERIQLHADAMEGALEAYGPLKWKLKRDAKEKNISDAKFRKLALKEIKQIENRK